MIVERLVPRRGFSVTGLAALFAAATWMPALAGDAPNEQTSKRREGPALAGVPAEMRLPRTLPPDVRSGRLRTPLGPARWVHVTGSGDEVPRSLDDLVAVPGGWAKAEYGGIESSGDPIDEPASLWFSPDLVRWRTRPMPVEVETARLLGGDGRYWLVTWPDLGDWRRPGRGVPASLWHSSDARAWDRIDLGPLSPPEPAPVGWVLSLGEVVWTGDVTVVPVMHRLAAPGELLGLAPQFHRNAWLEQEPDGSYRIRGGWGEHIADIRLEEGPDYVRVIESVSGEELATVEGVDVAFIERMMLRPSHESTWDPVRVRMAIIEEGAVRYGGTPPLSPGSELHIAAEDGGFLVVVDPLEGPLETWRSSDAESWQAGPLIGDDPGEPELPVHVSTAGERWYATNIDAGRIRRWRSDDGISWERIRAGGAQQRLARGAYRLRGVRWFEYQPDGEAERQRRSLRPLGIRRHGCPDRGAGGRSQGTLGDAIVYLSLHRDGGAGCRDHWLIQFERLAR